MSFSGSSTRTRSRADFEEEPNKANDLGDQGAGRSNKRHRESVAEPEEFSTCGKEARLQRAHSRIQFEEDPGGAADSLSKDNTRPIKRTRKVLADGGAPSVSATAAQVQRICSRAQFEEQQLGETRDLDYKNTARPLKVARKILSDCNGRSTGTKGAKAQAQPCNSQKKEENGHQHPQNDGVTKTTPRSKKVLTAENCVATRIKWSNKEGNKKSGPPKKVASKPKDNLQQGLPKFIQGKNRPDVAVGPSPNFGTWLQSKGEVPDNILRDKMSRVVGKLGSWIAARVRDHELGETIRPKPRTAFAKLLQ